MTQPNKQWNIWDTYIDNRDSEPHETTIIAIDNKWRYIVEVDDLPNEVFVEDNLDWVEEQEKADWIEDMYNYWFVYCKHDWTLKHFREAIEKHLPKQELIPLDVEKICDDYVKRMQEVFNKWDEKRDAWYELKQIISKYCTTPQKKRTKEMLDDYCSSYAIYDKEQINILQQFIIDNDY